MLEHKYLCQLLVLPKTDMSARVTYQVDRSSQHSIQTEVNVAPFLLNIGPSVVHTLHATMCMWTQVSIMTTDLIQSLDK